VDQQCLERGVQWIGPTRVWHANGSGEAADFEAPSSRIRSIAGAPWRPERRLVRRSPAYEPHEPGCFFRRARSLSRILSECCVKSDGPIELSVGRVRYNRERCCRAAKRSRGGYHYLGTQQRWLEDQAVSRYGYGVTEKMLYRLTRDVIQTHARALGLGRSRREETSHAR
jgi:hypothetical protein